MPCHWLQHSWNIHGTALCFSVNVGWYVTASSIQETGDPFTKMGQDNNIAYLFRLIAQPALDFGGSFHSYCLHSSTCRVVLRLVQPVCMLPGVDC